MKYLKTIFAAAALAVLSLSAFAQAPTYAPQAFAFADCAASTATNIAYVIDCRKQANVAVQVVTTNTAAGAGAGAGSYILAYQRSVDGSTYETALSVAASPTQNGTSATCWTTNLNSQGCGYIKLAYLTNAMQSGTNIGSILIKYAPKINSP